MPEVTPDNVPLAKTTNTLLVTEPALQIGEHQLRLASEIDLSDAVISLVEAAYKKAPILISLLAF